MLADTKQADVIRNGKGNVYMGLSKGDSDILWQAVQDRKFLLPSFLPFSYLPPTNHPLLLQNQRDHNTDRQCEFLIDNLAKFNTINNKLLNPPGTPLRNIPLKIYLPTTSALPSSSVETEVATVQASVRTVQGLIAPFSATTRKFVVFSPAFDFLCSALFLTSADIVVQVNQIHWVWR
jgi:autophagy-related protein 5